VSGPGLSALWAIPASILGPAYTSTGRCAEAIPLLRGAAEIASVLGAPVLAFSGGVSAVWARGRGAPRGTQALRLAQNGMSGDGSLDAAIARRCGGASGKPRVRRLKTPIVERCGVRKNSQCGTGRPLPPRPRASCIAGAGEADSPAFEHLGAAARMFREMRWCFGWKPNGKARHWRDAVSQMKLLGEVTEKHAQPIFLRS